MAWAPGADMPGGGSFRSDHEYYYPAGRPAASIAPIAPSLAFDIHSSDLDMYFVQLGLDLRAATPMDGMLDVPAGIDVQEPPVAPTNRRHSEFFAQGIAALEDEKAHAVSEEDFEQAKALKLGLEEMRGLAEKVERCEVEKARCIKVEDYDGAGEQKARIVKMADRARSLLQQLRERRAWRATDGHTATAAAPGRPPQPRTRQRQAPPPAARAPEAPHRAPEGSTVRASAQHDSGETSTTAVGGEPAGAYYHEDRDRDLAELFGSECVRRLRSSSAEERTQGCRQLSAILTDSSMPRVVPAVLLAGTIDAVLPMLELSASGDEGCLEAALSAASTAVGICAPSLPLHTVGQQLQPVLHSLLSAASDSSATASGRGAARRGALHLASQPNASLEQLGHVALRDESYSRVRSEDDKHAAAAKLQLVQSLLARGVLLQQREGGPAAAGVQKGQREGAAERAGVSLAKMQELLLIGLQSEDEDVRSIAVDASVALYRRVGAQGLRAVIVGTGLRPALMRVLKFNFDEVDRSG